MFQVNKIMKNIELSTFCNKLINEILSDLKKIDITKLSEKSKIDIIRKNDKCILNIEIKPKDKYIPSLYINASEDYCHLGVFDHEEIEYYGDTDSNVDVLIKQIKTILKKYLSGITIVEYYNKKGKVLKRDYYYGLNSELKKENKAGSSIYYLNFFQKIYSQKNIQYRFMT